MDKPCKDCDGDYPDKPGILMGRDELWTMEWHTHKRTDGLKGHLVFKDDGILSGEVKELGSIPNFPWEEGHEAYWDENAHSKFKIGSEGEINEPI